MTWTDEDGWPAPFPAALLVALRALPGSAGRTDAEIEAFAALLMDARDEGVDRNRARWRATSENTARQELIQLGATAERLERHAGALHRPAADALFGEGLTVDEIEDFARRIADVARVAVSSVESAGPVAEGGFRHDAAFVEVAAAAAYQQITGAEPGRGSDAVTNRPVGPYARFLSAVFKALRIEASVEHYLRARPKK